MHAANDTRKIALVLIWELWLQTRGGIALRLVMSLTFILLFSLAHEAQDEAQQSLRGLQAGFFLVCILAGISGLGLAQPDKDTFGFPLQLHFAKPVATWLLTLIPMIYLSIAAFVMYAVPVFVSHIAYEMPRLMLLSCWLMVPISLLTIAGFWWTGQKSALIVGWILLFFGISLFAYETLHFSEIQVSNSDSFWTEFSFTTYDVLSMLLISATAIALTALGVSKQRCGEDLASLFKPSPENSNWHNVIPMPACPTSTGKRAEVWAELHGRGIPIFFWSLGVAIVTPSMWLLMNYFDLRVFWWITTLCMLMAPFATSPSFGVTMQDGVADMSLFQATRPQSTLWLVCMQILIAVGCMLAGAAAIATSFWYSLPLIDDFIPEMFVFKHFMIDWFSRQDGQELVGSIAILFFQFATVVTFVGIMHSLYALFADRLTLMALGVVAYLCLLATFIATKVLPVEAGTLHAWPLTIGILVMGVYFAIRLRTLNTLTLRQLSIICGIWLIYAWLFISDQNDQGLFDAPMNLELIVFHVGVCTSSLFVLLAAIWCTDTLRHR